MKRGACLLIAALALAGCGGGDSRLSRSEYESTMRSAFAAAAAQLQADPGSTQSLASIAAAYRRLASSLDRVRPPVEVQMLHDQLVAGAAREANALGALVTRIDGAPKAAREQLLAEFDPTHIEGQQQIDRAVAGLTAKGYRFRPSAGT